MHWLGGAFLVGLGVGCFCSFFFESRPTTNHHKRQPVRMARHQPPQWRRRDCGEGGQPGVGERDFAQQFCRTWLVDFNQSVQGKICFEWNVFCVQATPLFTRNFLVLLPHLGWSNECSDFPVHPDRKEEEARQPVWRRWAEFCYCFLEDMQ